jgi:hypothetical protein
VTHRTPPRRARTRLPTLLGLAGMGLGFLLLAAVVAIAVLRGGSDPRSHAAPARSAAVRVGSEVVRWHDPRTRAAERPEPRPARPVRVVIPSIGVRAPVIPLGLNEDRTLEVPTDFGDTGWWTGGPRPGERGPAVIAGHVDSTSGPAVFYRIGELRPGAAILVVGRDGKRVRFEVDRTEQYPKSNFPTARVYGPTPGPTLRLITCSGDFDESSGHYIDNTVVYAAMA